MPSLGFEITAENRDLLKKFQESERAAEQYAAEMVKAGDAIDREFSNSVQSVVSNINTLSNEITQQKRIIAETEADVKRYTTELANFNPASSVSKSDIEKNLKTAKQALEEQKFSLGELKIQQEEAKNTLSNLNNEYKVFKKELKEAEAIEKESAAAMESLNKSTGDLVSDMSKLPGPVGQAASGIQSMTKAALAFLATPLGIALAAISAALALVTTWFKRTEEGQHALNVASKTFGQVLKSISDVAANVGEWLFKAFTSPKEAVADLGKFIDDQINNRLTGLAKMGDAIAKIFQSGLKEGWGDLGNAFSQTLTGIEDAGKKAVGFYDDIVEKAEKAAKIAERENALSVKNREFLVKRSELEAKIAKHREDAYDASRSDAERSQSLVEAKKLTQELYDTEIELAKEAHAIIKETNEISHSNAEDKNKEAEALAKINQLETRRSGALKSILRESNRYNKSTNTSVEDQKRLLQELTQLQIDNIRSSIDLMEEGHEKRMAQIEHDYEQEIKKLEEKVAKWKEVQKGVLTDEQASTVELAVSNADAKRIKEIQKLKDDAAKKEKQSWIEYNKEYGDYQAKRLAIAEDYAEKIANAQTGGEKAALEKQRGKALDELDRSMLEQSKLWTRLFDDADRHTSNYIKKTIDELQKLVDYINGVDGSVLPDGWTDEKIKAMFKDASDVEAAMNQIKKLRDELNKRNPFGQLARGFKDLKAAGKDAEKQFAATKDIIEGFQGVTSAINQVVSALQEAGLEADSTLSQISSALSNTASMAAQGFAIGNVPGAIVGGMIGLGTSIVGMLGGAKELSEETIRSYNSYMSVIDELIEKQKELIRSTSGSEATKLADKTAEYIQKQIEATQEMGKEWLNSGSGLFSHSEGKKLAKSLKPYKDELASIGIEFDKLGGRMEGLFDLDPATLYKLKYELPLIWSKIDSETQAYLETLIASTEATENLGDVLSESLTGTTFEGLQDSLTDLATQFDLTAEDIADSFENHMKGAIQNIIKTKYLTDKLLDWYDDFEEAMSDGLLSESDVNKLQQQYADIVTNANEAFIKAMEAAGLDVSSSGGSSSLSASERGINGVTQDTMSEVLGQLRALRMDIAVAAEYFRTRDINIASITSEIALLQSHAFDIKVLVQSQLNTLVMIERNTYNTVSRLDQIIDNGVKIKEGN